MIKIFSNQDTSNCNRSDHMEADETHMLAEQVLDFVETGKIQFNPEECEATAWEIIEDFSMSSAQDISLAVHGNTMRRFLDDARHSNDAPLDSVLACLSYAEWRMHYLDYAWRYGEPLSPKFKNIICPPVSGEDIHLGEPLTLLSSSWLPDWACLRELHGKTVALADTVERDLINPARKAEDYVEMADQAGELFGEWLHYANYLGRVTINSPMLSVACNKLMLTSNIQPSEFMALIAFFRYMQTMEMVQSIDPPEARRTFEKKRDYRLQQRHLLSVLYAQ